MSEIMKIDTVRQYNDYFGVETLHLSVSVIEGCKAKPLRYCRKLYNLYAILLKDTDCGQLKYGQSCYDYRQGTMLFLASTMQQLGMFMGTTAGKSGFLTACYILIVPVLGIFFKRKCSWNIWIGIVITIGGLYLLCVKESLSLAASDLVTLVCALLFAGHIMVIDYFSPLVDGVRLSCIQFFACGILGFFPMVFCEIIPDGMAAWTSTFASSQAWIALLYSGVMSCGVAYTLQIIGQNGLNPTLASMIMSLESVFSVLTGWLILDEQLGGREIMGCVLIFAAILLAQVPVGKKIKS